MPVHDPAKGEKATDVIRGLVPGAKISTRALDLASLDWARPGSRTRRALPPDAARSTGTT
ncbi:hypothetical protein [Streptomyces sp. GMR22]|uniref:hypothetical protein n=1 Tax=Streptomyces sp. GMR22 TaxID=2759524 RepID=UPI0015FDA597|nr:hypothetical protein [Streptomyces sp. GMR22]MBA6434503.1 hypothetical protein [Streptomyces sp. GMR22]